MKRTSALLRRHILPRAIFSCSHVARSSSRPGARSDEVPGRRRLTLVESGLQSRPHWDPAMDVTLPSQPKRYAIDVLS